MTKFARRGIITRSLHLLLCLALYFAAAAMLRAQSTSETLRGNVLDPSGAAAGVNYANGPNGSDTVVDASSGTHCVSPRVIAGTAGFHF
jgi:hypothetical protein